ncbi:unnamed protein product, partial [Mesorhabditis spiculigera]
MALWIWTFYIVLFTSSTKGQICGKVCQVGEVLCDAFLGDCGKCVPQKESSIRCIDRKYVSLCSEPGTVKCTTTENCVFEKWLADGQNDCGDGSDEEPCASGILKCNSETSKATTTTITEPPTTAYVSNTKNVTTRQPQTTVPNLGSDIDKPCPPGHFQCSNGDCIKFAKILDGNNDCKDKMDEIYCTVEDDGCPSNKPCSFQPDVASFG